MSVVKSPLNSAIRLLKTCEVHHTALRHYQVAAIRECVNGTDQDAVSHRADLDPGR